jgi:succinate dehydrogenase / fumarate reductase, flavoprotein subunit
VFGKLSGTGAKKYLDGLSKTPRADDEQIIAAFRRATAPLNRDSGENPYVLHEDLTAVMGRYVGIVRSGPELERGLEELQALKQRALNVKANGASQYNPGWHEALSMSSLLITSEAVALAALMREESRGAHTRIDFENERPEWLKYNIVIRKGRDGQPQVEKVERRPPPDYLKQIAEANIDDLEAGKVGADAPEE